MEVGILSMRYAKALIDFATDQGAEGVVYEEFLRLTSGFRTHPTLRTTLDNPIVPMNEKITLVSVAANGDKPSSEAFTRFIRLVLEHKREEYLQTMGLMYIDLYRKLKHIGVGRLVTAVPVDKATEERIRSTAAHILHARMELETVVDPSIEGGFVFDINDVRLDASVATQLKRVKKQYIDKNKRIV